MATFTDLVFPKKSIPQGAATTVWACVSPEAGSEKLRGRYLEDCGPKTPSRNAIDSKTSEALWEVTKAQLAEAAAKLA